MRGALLVSLLPLAASAQEFKEVSAILAANCAGCHNATSKMGNLDLGTPAGLGSVVTPRKSAESRLYLRITGAAKPQMPMGGKPLAAGEIETIRKWIDGGAVIGEMAPAPPAIPDKIGRA